MEAQKTSAGCPTSAAARSHALGSFQCLSPEEPARLALPPHDVPGPLGEGLGVAELHLVDAGDLHQGLNVWSVHEMAVETPITRVPRRSAQGSPPAPRRGPPVGHGGPPPVCRSWPWPRRAGPGGRPGSAVRASTSAGTVTQIAPAGRAVSMGVNPLRPAAPPLNGSASQGEHVRKRLTAGASVRVGDDGHAVLLRTGHVNAATTSASWAVVGEMSPAPIRPRWRRRKASAWL